MQVFVVMLRRGETRLGPIKVLTTAEWGLSDMLERRLRMRARQQETTAGQISKMASPIQLFQQEYEVGNFFRPKRCVVDLSQWTKKSKIL